jgi:hypothetical protein
MFRIDFAKTAFQFPDRADSETFAYKQVRWPGIPDFIRIEAIGG